jgi:probable rRNA maturation factor
MPVSNTSRQIRRKKTNIKLYYFPKNLRRAVLKAGRLALAVRSRARIGEVNIILLDDAKIKVLNRRFRKVNRKTDVISFRYGTSPLEGDIFLSKGVSKKQSAAIGHSWADELAYLAIHGILHLFGYTDYTPREKKKMFLLQDRIFRKLCSRSSD